MVNLDIVKIDLITLFGGKEHCVKAFSLVIPVAVGLAACLAEKHVSGKVTDFETDRPIQGATIRAAQHGWGISNGSLVWDKDYSTYTETDAAGAFTIGYRHGQSVNLWVEHQGYQRFQGWYPKNASVRVRLKQRIEGLKALPSGFLRLGQKTDGSYYGWDFATGRLATSADGADVFPESVELGSRGNMRLRVSGDGGIRFVSREELGVDHMFLIYTDTAPAVGYQATAELDFESDGGIYFVKTRDGEHYAKFEFIPTAFAMESAPDIARDLSLHYVYNPGGTRDLRYQGIGSSR
jgi:hypothetical protein